MRLKLTRTERAALRVEAESQGVSVAELVTSIVRRALSRPQWSDVAEVAALLAEMEKLTGERDRARDLAAGLEQEIAGAHEVDVSLPKRRVSMEDMSEAERLQADLISAMGRHDAIVQAAADEFRDAQEAVIRAKIRSGGPSREAYEAQAEACDKLERAQRDRDAEIDPMLMRREELRSQGAIS